MSDQSSQATQTSPAAHFGAGLTSVTIGGQRFRLVPAGDASPVAPLESRGTASATAPQTAPAPSVALGGSGSSGSGSVSRTRPSDCQFAGRGADLSVIRQCCRAYMDANSVKGKDAICNRAREEDVRKAVAQFDRRPPRPYWDLFDGALLTGVINEMRGQCPTMIPGLVFVPGVDGGFDREEAELWYTMLQDYHLQNFPGVKVPNIHDLSRMPLRELRCLCFFLGAMSETCLNTPTISDDDHDRNETAAIVLRGSIKHQLLRTQKNEWSVRGTRGSIYDMRESQKKLGE